MLNIRQNALLFFNKMYLGAVQKGSPYIEEVGEGRLKTIKPNKTIQLKQKKNKRDFYLKALRHREWLRNLKSFRKSFLNSPLSDLR